MIFALRECIFIAILGDYVVILSMYTYLDGFWGVPRTFRDTSDPSLAAVGLPVASARSHDHIPFYKFFREKM